MDKRTYLNRHVNASFRLNGAIDIECRCQLNIDDGNTACRVMDAAVNAAEANFLGSTKEEYVCAGFPDDAPTVSLTLSYFDLPDDGDLISTSFEINITECLSRGMHPRALTERMLSLASERFAEVVVKLGLEG